MYVDAHYLLDIIFYINCPFRPTTIAWGGYNFTDEEIETQSLKTTKWERKI